MLGVTGALTGYPPPTAEASGPVSVERRMGPIDLQLTVDPARVGANEVHLYLFEPLERRAVHRHEGAARPGAACPASGIGPLDLDPWTRPGRVTTSSPSADADPRRRLGARPSTDRVSDFDEHATTVKAEVR